MTTFAQSLFTGSPFLRCILGTVALACAVGIPFLNADALGVAFIVGLFLQALAILLFVAMVAPKSCAWAGRVLSGLVFLAYVAYFADRMWFDPASLEPASTPGGSTAFNALIGLSVIGLPALKYALTGRALPSCESVVTRPWTEVSERPDSDAA